MEMAADSVGLDLATGKTVAALDLAMDADHAEAMALHNHPDHAADIQAQNQQLSKFL